MSKEPVQRSDSRSAPPPRGSAPRVIIIEDQRLIAEFLTLHCRSMDLAVLATCATLGEGLAACRAQSPDLVLMDFSLGDGDGLEAARTLMGEFPALRILGVSSHRDPWTMLQVQRIGLHGFVDKHDPRPEELTKAIRTVLEGRTYYTQALTQGATTLRQDPNAFNRVLSDYEIRILSLIGSAKTDDEIAAELGIRPATMQSRRRDIMRKLDIHTTPKLIHFAIVNGLTRAEQLTPAPH